MFKALKILHPVWYFNLRPAVDHNYFPHPDEVTRLAPEITPDKNFSPRASGMELAYRAHRNGMIVSSGKKFDWWNDGNAGLKDEYIFARKYFHITRAAWLLLYRICTLHNPFKEIDAFISARHVKRFRLQENNFSIPVKNNKTGGPFVSVIIPTLNRYAYLKDVLHDLERQEYRNFDVIVIDQSEPYNPEFYKQFDLKLHVIRQEEKALWLARNTAVKYTPSELLLFYDDDSRTDSHWIGNHVTCLDFFNADISSGVSISRIGADVPENYRIYRWSDQLDTGNVLIKREVFRKIGLFDRQFEKQRMGDGEFGLRAYLAGFRNISNPDAKRLHLKVESGGLRESGGWDAFRPKNIFAPRPVPSVLYFYRKYHGRLQAIKAVFLNILPSIVPYRYKSYKALLLLGALLSIFMLPFILYQVFRSWSISTKMLAKNDIDPLSA